jgi:apolipoprotein N-acyltransferase
VLTLTSKYWELLTFTAGILLSLAFSPFEYSYLAIISLAILFSSWESISPKRALLRGYLFGLGLFGVGISWVYVSVHDYGGASLFISIIITLIFVGFWALFPALAGYLTCKLLPPTHRLGRLATMPFVWMLVEYFRGQYVLNGFPWLQISYSQLETPLSGYIPVVGGYAVGLLLSVTAIIILLVISYRKYIYPGIGILLVIWLFGGWLQGKNWTQSQGDPITVTLIQGNVSQDQKWRPESRQKIINRYQQLTYQHWDADLIIWPETAIPAFLDQVQERLLQPLAEKARRTNTDVVVSLPVRENKSKPYYNAVLVLGQQTGMYRKVHLLPFGEYLPLQPLSGYLLKQLKIMPIGSFSPGDYNQPLLTGAGYPFSTSICYEDVFSKLVIKDLPEASYLVNVTNDGWFGDSIEPHQHMQLARMRAIETGRFLLRTTNTGLTGVVAPDGKIINQAPLFQEATITTDITPMQGMTPYARIGDLPVILLMLFLLCCIVIGFRVRKGSV